MSPGIILFTQYMIVNFAFWDTCFEAHTLHMREPMRYTSQRTAIQDTVVLEQTTWITFQKLTGLEVNELVEASEDQETWRELVVMCVDPQPPD